MAAANIVKYMFLTTICFFGTKILFLIKQTNENQINAHIMSSNGDNLDGFQKDLIEFDENEKGIENRDSFDQYDDVSNTKRQQMDGNLEINSRKPENTTVVSSLQRKRKLLSQLWDQYYKVQLTKSNKIKVGNKFKQLGENIFVFSAYFDDRLTKGNQNAVVRILTISKIDSKDTLACKYTRAGKWVLATKAEMSDSHSKPYGGVMYTCNIPGNIGNEPPKTVYLQSALVKNGNPSMVTHKLVTDKIIPAEMSNLKPSIYQHLEGVRSFNSNLQKTYNSRNFLETSPIDNKLKEIHSTDKSEKFSNNHKGRELGSILTKNRVELLNLEDKTTRISVCVSPLFGDIKLSDFIQFVEIHKILGVDHIFFYKMNVSTDIERMLEYYKSHGIITLTDWSLPGILQDSTKIWYHGQVTAQQDCLYKNIGNFDFTAFVDLDEIIIPYTSSTWQGMLQNLQKNNHNENLDAAAFMFKSAFFEPVASTEQTNSLKHRKLSFLRNIYRNNIISTTRSKVIIKPDFVEQIGIHHVSKLLNLHKTPVTVDVPMETALIHHYRKCTEALDSAMHCGKYVADESLTRYSEILVNNYEKALEENIPYLRRL